MNNFIETFKSGKEGKNFGLSMGIPALDKVVWGLQKGMSIGIAAAPKVGKTTFADFTCVLSPYLHAEKLGILDKIEWIYFSGEISRVVKEFKFAAFFMAHDHQIYNFKYKEKVYNISGEYLMGKMVHVNEDGAIEQIKVQEDHENLLKIVYLNRIIPIFGEYNTNGEKIRAGKIEFIEDLENPTGLNKFLIHHAEQNGSFIKSKYSIKEEGKIVHKERIVSYRPKDPEKFTIILTDHIRKLRRERGFTMKENIDKWLEYSTILRNICQYIFIHVCHSNRGVSNVDRLKFAGEWIFPTGDDIKDSGNLSEECTLIITLFNPNDEKYNLEKHFGVELKDYPNYRSIHVVEARNGIQVPAHIQTNMFGGINTFSPLNVS